MWSLDKDNQLPCLSDSPAAYEIQVALSIEHSIVRLVEAGGLSSLLMMTAPHASGPLILCVLDGEILCMVDIFCFSSWQWIWLHTQRVSSFKLVPLSSFL